MVQNKFKLNHEKLRMKQDFLKELREREEKKQLKKKEEILQKEQEKHFIVECLKEAKEQQSKQALQTLQMLAMDRKKDNVSQFKHQA